MKNFVTIFTLAAVFASSEAGPQGRIMHGNYANEGQFRHFVGISEDSGDTVHCGGAIISNYWVITAAHCVENVTHTLHFGSTNFSSPVLNVTIPRNSIIRHPDYNTNTSDNDIALIRTPYIEFTNKIHKVCLPSIRGVPDVTGEVVTGIGWGRDEYGVYDQHHLKFVYMRVMPNDECKRYFLDGVIHERRLCSMTYSGGTCFGDSGGPLLLEKNKMLVGIITFLTDVNCTQGLPSGSVRITSYLHWIKSVSGVYRK